MSEELTQPIRPGRRAARRSLDFFFICDTSGSMVGRRIESLNAAAENALPSMRRQAAANYTARISVRVLAFDDEVRWVTHERMPVDRFEWTPLHARAGRLSSIGDALVAIASELRAGVFEEPALAPVLVLVSDGFTLRIPGRPSLHDGLAAIAAERAGAASLRYAVAIGGERRTDALDTFVGPEQARVRVLTANRTSELADVMAWVSSVPILRASEPHGAETPPPATEGARETEGATDDWIA